MPEGGTKQMKLLTEQKKVKNRMAGVAATMTGLGIAAWSSVLPAFASNTTSGTLDALGDGLESFVKAVYDKILFISPFLAVLVIAVLFVIYIFSDEKDAEKIKKRCVRIGVVLIGIILIPVIVKIVQELGTTMAGDNGNLDILKN